MTQTPLLDVFASIRVDARERRKAAAPSGQIGAGLVADGHVYAIADLHRSIDVTRAYAAYLRAADLERLARFVRADALVLDGVQVEDLSPLARMNQLQWLQVSWNTKVKSLDPLARIKSLTRLSIEHTPKVRDLDPLATLPALVALDYSGGMWAKNTAISLDPIAKLPALEELQLTNVNVVEGGLRPLAAARRLRRLNVSNQFETSDYAFLSVALPGTDCKLFAPYVELHAPIGDRDVMVVGRRKGFLNAKRDAAILARHVAAFEIMQGGFRREIDVLTSRTTT